MAWLDGKQTLLLGVSICSLGCGTSVLEGAGAAVMPVAGAELEYMAQRDEAQSELELQMWGKEPPTADGEIVELHGEVEGEPVRLWFVVPGKLEPDQAIELHETGAAQLTVGKPYTFVSNRVALHLRLREGGRRGYLSAEASRNELPGPATLELEGEFALRFRARTPVVTTAEAPPPELLPRRDYVPQVLPYFDGHESPPPGYVVRRQPRKQLILAGSILFAGSYLLPFMIAAGLGFDGYSGWYAAPVIGPTAFLTQYLEDGNEPGLGLIGFGIVGMGSVLLSAAQLGGIALVTIGSLARRRSWALPESDTHSAHQAPTVTFAPIANPGVQGFTLSGTF